MVCSATTLTVVGQPITIQLKDIVWQNRIFFSVDVENLNFK